MLIYHRPPCKLRLMRKFVKFLSIVLDKCFFYFEGTFIKYARAPINKIFLYFHEEIRHFSSCFCFNQDFMTSDFFLETLFSTNNHQITCGVANRLLLVLLTASLLALNLAACCRDGGGGLYRREGQVSDGPGHSGHSLQSRAGGERGVCAQTSGYHGVPHCIVLQ